MTSLALPLVVLGGSDSQPAELPPRGQDSRPLTGCKGVDLLLDGRPLIAELVERLRATDRFDRVFIAGPAAAYEGVVPDAVLIDTDSDFGTNIRAAVEAVRDEFPAGPVAFSTCDILPTASDLELSFDDYDQAPDCDVWFPIVESPEAADELGASAWKPRYRLQYQGRAVPVLPGHLAVVDPEAMRLDFMYRLLRSAYQTRNRPIFVRRAVMLRQMVLGILFHDLLHLTRLRLPTLTWDTVVTGTRGARRLREQKLTQEEAEVGCRKLFVKRRHRRDYPQRRVRLPILPTLSLARDIDTVEEARSLGATAAVTPP